MKRGINMRIELLKGINTLEELKSAYRKLALSG